MSEIIRRYYKKHFIEGSEDTRFIYTDPQGHFSEKSYKTLEECEEAIDETAEEKLTYLAFDTATDAETFRYFLTKEGYKTVGISYDDKRKLYKVSYCYYD